MDSHFKFAHAKIKKELKMPEYADWSGQDRLGLYIDAAYKSVKK